MDKCHGYCVLNILCCSLLAAIKSLQIGCKNICWGCIVFGTQELSVEINDESA